MVSQDRVDAEPRTQAGEPSRDALTQLARFPQTVVTRAYFEWRLADFYGSERAAEAIPYLREAEAHLRQAQKFAEQITVSRQLAAALRTTGQIDAAIREFRIALALAERTQKVEVQANIWGAFGHVYAKEKLDFRSAADFYRRAVSLFGRVNDEASRLIFLESLSDAELEGRRYKEALTAYRELADAIDAHLPKVKDVAQQRDLRRRRRVALNHVYHLALRLSQLQLSDKINTRIEALPVEESTAP